MTAAEDREIKLRDAAQQVKDFYASSGQSGMAVTLFAEDFDWLVKRNRISVLDDSSWFGTIKVRRGYRKRRPRKKRPKEALI